MYSYIYEVHLHIRGIAAPPTRYSYTWEVQLHLQSTAAVEVQLHLRGTATPIRYSFTYEVQLYLRGALTPTLEKTTKIIFEIYLQKLVVAVALSKK
jgi:hypothetical protein